SSQSHLKTEAGSLDNVAITDEGSMSLFSCVSAESVSSADLEFHQIAMKTRPFRSRQISRFRRACPLNLRALRISQFRLQPLQNDFLVVLRIFTIDGRIRDHLDFGRLGPDQHWAGERDQE